MSPDMLKACRKRAFQAEISLSKYFQLLVEQDLKKGQ